jgi:hypothetical protein
MGARTLAAAFMLAAALASAGALANQNQERRERDEQRNDRGGAEESKTVHAITFVDGSGQINITSVIVVSNTGAVLGALTGNGVRRVDEDRLDLGGVPLIGGLFGDDEDDYDDEEGPPRARIGYAYLVGNTLAVDLSEPVQPGSAHASKLRLQDIEEGLKPASVTLETRIMEVSNATATELGIDYDWQDRRLELDTFKLLNTSYSYQMPATQFLNIGYTEDAPLETTSGGTASSGGKIPILGDIPLLGDLFRHRAGDAYLEGRRLIVLVRPSILEDDYE